MIQFNVSRDLKPLLSKWTSAFFKCPNRWQCNQNSRRYLMFFTKRRPKEQFHLKLFNEIIQKKNETKFLGITLDHRLSFKPHADQTAAKGHNIFYRLYPIFKSPSLSIWAKKTFYIMMIQHPLCISSLSNTKSSINEQNQRCSKISSSHNLWSRLHYIQ